MKTQTKISALVLATVRMLVLACIASILLVFLAPMGARPAEQEAEVVAAEPTIDAVALIDTYGLVQREDGLRGPVIRR